MSEHRLQQSPKGGSIKKALILGNGPSAERVDFAKLGYFDVFGMNAAYRHWERINWYPQYYSCLDLVVGESHETHIKHLIENAHINGIKHFLLRQSLVESFGDIKNADRIVVFETLQKKHKTLRAHPLTTGSHTAAWASILGYNDLCLMGVDCDYVEHVDGAQQNTDVELEIVAKKNNPNYYFDDYQRIGDKYSVPNPNFEVHQESWRAIAAKLESENTRICNGNPDSQLSIFDYFDFDYMCANNSLKIIQPTENHLHQDPGTSGLKKPTMNKRQINKVLGRPFYADFGDFLKNHAPILFRLGQFVVKSIRTKK